MTDRETKAKSLTVELKAGGENGEFSATFATFDVVDAHEDVTLPQAFKAGTPVLIGAYQHNAGFLPVGKGVIRTDARRAFVEGRFNLRTTLGRDTYEAVKDAGSLMEWSYIYRATKWSRGDFEGRPVRFLEEVDVFSVDPVLKGAGVGTGTTSIKSSPMTFADHADGLITAAEAFARRVEGRIEMRAKDGRTMSADDRTQLAALATGLKAIAARLDESLAGIDARKSSNFLAEQRMRFERLRAGISG